jgi:hypothetical protein
MARKARQQTKKLSLDSNNDNNDDDAGDSYDSSTSHNTTDEEYFALIAGGADDDDDDVVEEVEQPWMKRVREAFEAADENADGTLSLQEARHLFLATGGGIGADFATTTTTSRRLEVLEAKMDRILQLLEEQQQQRIS